MNPITFIVLGCFLLILFLYPFVSKLLKFLKMKYQSIINSYQSNTLADEFDVLRWHQGDIIKYNLTQGVSDHWNEVTKPLVSFKEDGIYVIDMKFYKDFELGRLSDEILSSYVEFVPTNRIVENQTLPKRQVENDFLETVQDEFSYNNKLISIQQELEELNKEYSNEVNKVRL